MEDGRDLREWTTGTARDRLEALEASFLLHQPLDGIFVHSGCTDQWAQTHQVERLETHWRVTHRETGEAYGLLPGPPRKPPTDEPAAVTMLVIVKLATWVPPA